MAPKSMMALISIRVLLPMVWTHIGSSVPLQSVIEQKRTGIGSEDWWGGSWCMAFSVLGLVVGGCGVNISLVDPTVLVSNTEKLLAEWGMGFTFDQPENPLQPSLTPSLVWLSYPHPLIHCSHNCFGYNA